MSRFADSCFRVFSVFQNGLRKLDQGQRSASSTGQRYSDIAAELQQRKDRLRSTDVGSEAWIAEG